MAPSRGRAIGKGDSIGVTGRQQLGKAVSMAGPRGVRYLSLPPRQRVYLSAKYDPVGGGAVVKQSSGQAGIHVLNKG